ncbi:MAG: hypothetical protein ABIU63_16200 [Chitinophagaceae bacterium]
MSKCFSRVFLSVGAVILFICSGTNAGHAQSNDSLLKIYNTQTIQTSGTHFIKGGTRLTFRDLKSDFTSGITKDLYKKAKGDKILGGAFTVTAVGALVTGIIVRKNNNALASVLTGFAIGLNLSSLHFRNRSTQLLDRAIWHRNKEILFRVAD